MRQLDYTTVGLDDKDATGTKTVFVVVAGEEDKVEGYHEINQRGMDWIVQ